MNENEEYYQTSIFDFMYPKKEINKPIRMLEFFAGIGSQFKAMKEITPNVESWKICEWAYYSYCSYNAIHIKDFKDYSKDLTKEELIRKVKGTSLNYNEPLTETQLQKKPIEWLRNAYNNIVATHNLVNIMEVHGKDLEIVETDKYEYILTYSFPCQDLSLAGKRKGMSVSQKDGGTRSGLLWEVERILDELNEEKEHSTLPQILLMENVPQVICPDFVKWQNKLSSLGYKNYVEILNAKNYGIPQNRKRCFMISILGDYSYQFPTKIKDREDSDYFLEKEVDKKYTLSDKFIKYLTAENTGKYGRKKAFDYALKSVNENGIAVSLTTRQGKGGLDNYILIKNKTNSGFLKAEPGDGIDISTRMHHHRGTVQKKSIQTITTMGGENIGVVFNEENRKK